MSLVGFWGFDENQTESGSGALVNGAQAGRSGGRAYSRASTGIGDFVTLPSAQTSFFFGLAINWPGYTVGAWPVGVFLAFLDATATIHFRLRPTANGAIELLGPANTVVATSANGVLTPNTWQSIQVGAVINDTTGSVEIKVDSVSVITYSGDTRNAGTGNVLNVQVAAASAALTLFDDAWCTNPSGSAPYNTYLGDCVVRSILPSGNGDSSGWTGSDGNSTDNYLLVDDPGSSLNTTDYVAASAAGLTDLYAMGDVPTSDTVLAYKSLTYAAKSDAGTPPVMKPVSKGASGTVREEAALTLATTFQLFASAINTTDPDGNALTPARINSMQAGVRSA